MLLFFAKKQFTWMKKKRGENKSYFILACFSSCLRSPLKLYSAFIASCWGDFNVCLFCLSLSQVFECEKKQQLLIYSPWASAKTMKVKKKLGKFSNNFNKETDTKVEQLWFPLGQNFFVCLFVCSAKLWFWKQTRETSHFFCVCI